MPGDLAWWLGGGGPSAALLVTLSWGRRVFSVEYREALARAPPNRPGRSWWTWLLWVLAVATLAGIFAGEAFRQFFGG